MVMVTTLTDVVERACAWREAGDPHSRAAVFLHGLGGRRTNWDVQLEALSDVRRCCAVDLPGYGDSAGLPGSLPEIAAGIAEWIAGLGQDQVDVVGLSFGGMVAAELGNILSQIGLNDLYPRGFQVIIEMDFLAGHGLGLDNRASLFLTNYSQDDVARLRARACPVDFCAARFQLACELLKVLVEVVNRLPFNFCGGLARGFPVLKGLFVFIAHDLVFAEGGLDQFTMAQVRSQPRGLRFELLGGGIHEQARISAR